MTNDCQFKMVHAYIGFGSNVGDCLAHINRALCLLSEAEGVSLIQVSSLYETEPVGCEEQDWFMNGVLEVETCLFPHQLLHLLKQTEKRVGRQQRHRWGPREIDLDLLMYDQCCIDAPDLTIPHPEMHGRNFVLVPFAEIAPQVVHPIFQQNIQTLLSHLIDGKVVRLATPPPF